MTADTKPTAMRAIGFLDAALMLLPKERDVAEHASNALDTLERIIAGMTTEQSNMVAMADRVEQLETAIKIACTHMRVESEQAAEAAKAGHEVRPGDAAKQMRSYAKTLKSALSGDPA